MKRKALFIGLGSAGQRHMRNLKRILGDEIQFLAYRVRRLDRVFNDNLKIVEGKNVTEEYNIQEFDDIDQALLGKPDYVFIANPNSMHMEYALKAAEAGCDIFMEKPVSVSLEGTQKLKGLIQEKGLIFYTGYQMRFHPCVMKMKEIVENGTLGGIINVQCEIGELLTKMHPYEDYREMTEAQKKKGGGVVLCQIHELDYLSWIFGTPSQVYSVGGRYSNLEIDVEDSVSSILTYSREGKEVFPVCVHQDFLQNPPVRKCRITGTAGIFEMDLLKADYIIYREEGKIERKEFQDFNRNEMFLKELVCFLEMTDKRNQRSFTLEEGLESLKIALAIKESMHSHKAVLFG